MELFIDWSNKADRFADEIESTGSFVEIYKLVNACIEKGYRINEGSIYYWLFNFIGKHLTNRERETKQSANSESNN